MIVTELSEQSDLRRIDRLPFDCVQQLVVGVGSC